MNELVLESTPVLIVMGLIMILIYIHQMYRELFYKYERLNEANEKLREAHRNLFDNHRSLCQEYDKVYEDNCEMFAHMQNMAVNSDTGRLRVVRSDDDAEH